MYPSLHFLVQRPVFGFRSLPDLAHGVNNSAASEVDFVINSVSGVNPSTSGVGKIS
jgi:hypothetical protein